MSNVITAVIIVFGLNFIFSLTPMYVEYPHGTLCTHLILMYLILEIDDIRKLLTKQKD